MITDELIDIFRDANELFIAKDKELFELKVSERTLCGALMLRLYETLKNTEYSNYYVDVEFNRNVGGKLKTINRNVEGSELEPIIINCDLIVHSRGENVCSDNLIAIEMKKSSGNREDKVKDKKRLMCLTKDSYDDVWSYDGKVLPEHVCGYKLGIYYEINFKRKEIYLEYYVKGKKNSENILSYN